MSRELSGVELRRDEQTNQTTGDLVPRFFFSFLLRVCVFFTVLCFLLYLGASCCSCLFSLESCFMGMFLCAEKYAEAALFSLTKWRHYETQFLWE